MIAAIGLTLGILFGFHPVAGLPSFEVVRCLCFFRLTGTDAVSNVVVDVRDDCSAAIGNKSFKTQRELDDGFKQLARLKPKPAVHVIADKFVKYACLSRVFKAMQPYDFHIPAARIAPP